MASRLFTPGLSFVLLLIVTALLYGRTLGYPYVYEDFNDAARFDHTVLTGPMLNPARLLTMVSLELSDALTPGSALGGHLVNVGWHLVNVCLLFALAWSVLPPWGAVLAAGVFALHPMQVEAVAYVSSRSELVAASGLLLALLAASLGSLTGAVVGVVFACLGKESSIMAWGLVPLWAILTRAPFPVRKFVVIGGVLAVAGGTVFLSQVSHLSIGLDLDLLGRTAAAVLRLTALVFVPIGQSIDHDWRGVSTALQSVSVALVAAFTLLSILHLWREDRSWVRLAWLSTLAMLLPRFFVPGTEGLHEHHFYSLVAVWSLCAGAWLSRSSRTGVTQHGW